MSPLVVLLLGFSSIYKYLVATALRLWKILRSLRSLRGYSLLEKQGYLASVFSTCYRQACRGNSPPVR